MGQILTTWKENIKTFYKKNIIGYFKFKLNLFKNFLEYKKLKRKKIHPYSIYKGLSHLQNIPSGNLQQLNALLELSVEAKKLNDYEVIVKLIQSYMQPYSTIKYRDYFLAENNGVYYTIDYQELWNHFLKNRKKIQNKILLFKRDFSIDPDRFYYVKELTRVLSLADDLLEEIFKIEN